MVPDQPHAHHRIPVCSRHGNPVIVTAKVRFRSRPPGWLWAMIAVAVGVAAVPVVFREFRSHLDRDPDIYLLALGTVVFVCWVAHLAVSKVVDDPHWGFCSRCRARRNVLALGAGASLALVFFSLVLYVPVVLPEQLGDEEISPIMEAIRWTVLFAPLFFTVAAAVLLAFARWTLIARGFCLRDGRTLMFRDPAPEFVAVLVGDNQSSGTDDHGVERRDVP